MRRRTRFNEASAELIAYLGRRHALTHAKLAEVLRVSPEFIARVATAEREFSPRQTQQIADYLGVGKGAMFIDASPITHPLKPEHQAIVDLCDRLLLMADAGYTPNAGSDVRRRLA